MLQAELPSGAPGFREPCQALIELAEGKVASCHIKSSSGRTILTGEDALDILNGLGTLNWLFSPRQEPLASGLRDSSMSVPVVRPMTSAPSPIPRRIVHVGQEDLNAWPRKYRRVYVLIDGERSAEKIAAMLSLPPGGVGEVLEVLRKLRSMGMIAME